MPPKTKNQGGRPPTLPPGGKYRSYYLADIHAQIIAAVRELKGTDNNSEALRTILERLLPSTARKKLADGTITKKEIKEALQNLRV